MTLSSTRIKAVARKEMRDFGRNRFIVGTMVVLPIVFMVGPVINIFNLPASAPATKLNNSIGLSALYLMLIPALIPAVIASNAVVGEREQGTLEPVLTTPVRREELLVGKAAAAFVPTVAIAYLMYGIFLAAIGTLAHPNVQSGIFQAPRITAQLLFTPLLAGWSIWAGIAVSTFTNDVRVAQQLSTLVSLPPLVVVALMGFNVIHPTLGLALALGGVLLVIDLFAWRFVSTLFDRERLVTSTRH